MSSSSSRARTTTARSAEGALTAPSAFKKATRGPQKPPAQAHVEAPSKKRPRVTVEEVSDDDSDEPMLVDELPPLEEVSDEEEDVGDLHESHSRKLGLT
jgi:hypothetical protein